MSHKCKVYVSKYDIMHMQCHYHHHHFVSHDIQATKTECNPLQKKLNHKEQKKWENYISLWCFKKKIGCKYANYCVINCKTGYAQSMILLLSSLHRMTKVNILIYFYVGFGGKIVFKWNTFHLFWCCKIGYILKIIYIFE